MPLDPRALIFGVALLPIAGGIGCTVNIGEGTDTPGFYFETDPEITEPDYTIPPGLETDTPGGPTPTLSDNDTPRPTEEPTPTEIPTPRPDPEPVTYAFQASLRSLPTELGYAACDVDEASDRSLSLSCWMDIEYERFGGIPLHIHSTTDASLDTKGALVQATTAQAITLGSTSLDRRYSVDAQTRTVVVQRGGATVTWQLPTDPAPLALWPWESDPYFGYTVPDVGLAYIAARAKEVGRLEPVLAVPDFFSTDFSVTGNGPCYTANERFCLSRGDGFLDSMTLTPVDGTLNRLAVEQPGGPPTVSVGGTSLPVLSCPLPESVQQREDRISRSPLPTLAVEHDIPAGEGPFPVALFVGDLGGQDRDWQYAGTPVARCLSLALLERGIAVARFDDRGTGESGGAVEDTSFEDRSTDFRAVYDHLQSQDWVAHDKVFIITNGEGAAHVIDTFPLRTDIAGIAAVAPFSGDGEDMWLDRTDAFLANMDLPADFVEEVHDQKAQDMTNIKQKRYLDNTFDGLSVDFWEEFLTFDATQAWSEITAPVLLVGGALDWEVSSSHTDVLKGALSGAGNSDVTSITYPNLGHHMSVPAGQPNVGQEYYLPYPWDVRVENKISDWVATQAD